MAFGVWWVCMAVEVWEVCIIQNPILILIELLCRHFGLQLQSTLAVLLLITTAHLLSIYLLTATPRKFVKETDLIAKQVLKKTFFESS